MFTFSVSAEASIPFNRGYQVIPISLFGAVIAYRKS